MKRRIDFTLNLIPLASGGWNFKLQAVGSGITPGYHSPLASYIDPERAVRQAREHASLIARRFSGTIGKIQISSAPSDQLVLRSFSEGGSDNPGGSHAGQD